MKKSLIFIIIGAAAILVGAMLFGAGILLAGGITGVRITEYKTLTETEEAERIEIDYSVADIVVKISDEVPSVSIEYPVTKNRGGELTSVITAEQRGGTLRLIEEPIWYRNIFSFGFSEEVVTVTLPASRVLDYSIECSTGDVTLEDGIKAGSLSISESTGDVTVGILDVDGKLDIESDTGDIKLTGRTAAEEIEIDTDTGDISILSEVKARSVNLSTDTGTVRLSYSMRCTSLDIESDTGDVLLMAAVESDSVSIETSTGDVKSTVHIASGTISVETSTGDISLILIGEREDYTVRLDLGTGDSNIESGGSGAGRLDISTSTGDVSVKFRQLTP